MSKLEERIAISRFRKVYRGLGLSAEYASRLCNNADFDEYIAEGIRRFSAKPPDYKLAQSILGADFITPEEVMKACTRIVYTDEQIKVLVENLPTQNMLKWCKENDYVVMPAPPTAMSLLDVRNIKSSHFYSETGGWYADQKFAREDKTSFGWLAIKKTPVANSTSKNWNEQSKLLSALEHVPNAAEMSWFITTYSEVRGIRLFKNVYVRTSSLGSDGDRVLVGRIDSRGLDVSHWNDDFRDDGLGVSAGRKIKL